MVKVAPVLPSASRSHSGPFRRPTPNPISCRRDARQCTGLSCQSISAQTASWKPTSDLHEDAAVCDPGRIGVQVLAGGGRFDHAAAAIEDGRMLGAFYRCLDDESVGQMHVFMGAQPVGAVVAVLVIAHDDEGSCAVIEPDHILRVDFVDCAGINPFSHSHSPQIAWSL